MTRCEREETRVATAPPYRRFIEWLESAIRKSQEDSERGLGRLPGTGQRARLEPGRREKAMRSWSMSLC